MTDYQPLNSAEEVQRAFAEGRYVEKCYRDEQDWYPESPTLTEEGVRAFMRHGVKFRTTKPAPTPEAERRELHAMAADTGPLTVAALVSAELEAERPALVGGEDGLRALPAKWRHFVRTVLGQGPSGAAMLECARELEAALSVPAAQDGDADNFTDTSRAALAWVLYHHQGGSSPVGQPLRFALGMGQHDRLTDTQIAEAKRWAEMTGSTTADFHGPTPNAIRGDKGAEAVDALPIRDVKEIVSKYVGRTSRIYLYIANDLSQLHREQLAAAPTQAAAKDTP